MLEFINTYFFGTVTPSVLIAAGLFFSFRLKFFHIAHPALVCRTLVSPAGKNGVSPVRALSLALAGTLGVGNIVGVASAIYLGGAGSVFWMWISALAAMILKYAETVLALKYRVKDNKGEYHGGAMYYIKSLFSRSGLAKAGTVTAAVFAMLCIFDALSMGCMIQVNAVSRSMLGVFGIGTALTGGVLALIVFAVITSGREAVMKVTEKIVPLMTAVYIIMSVCVMFIRSDRIIPSLMLIVRDAFRRDCISAGILGFIVSRSLRYGCMRGIMSNEAGCGTAPIAHASSSADFPAEQGIWGIFEVFVDTIVLCTMTAVVIIVSLDDVIAFGSDPVMMTLKAYSLVLGRWSEYAMCMMVLLFGFATVICWSHYGMECVEYLSGKRIWKRLYSAGCAAAVAAGAVCAPGVVWDIADIALGSMTLINIAVICQMSGEVKKETDEYMGYLKKAVPGYQKKKRAG